MGQYECPKCGGSMVPSFKSIGEKGGLFNISIRRMMPRELQQYSKLEVRVCDRCGYSEIYWKR